MRKKKPVKPESVCSANLEKVMVDSGVCMGPGECNAFTKVCCRYCGWNKHVHAARVEAARTVGLSTAGNLLHIDLSTVVKKEVCV